MSGLRVKTAPLEQNNGIVGVPVAEVEPHKVFERTWNSRFLPKKSILAIGLVYLK